jgi:hypothetical protein
MLRRIRFTFVSLMIGLAAATLTGCASTHDPASAEATPLPPRISAPATLNPDGTVPWVNEPATDADFDPPTPPPAPALGSSCPAAALRGTLDRWIAKTTDGEVADPIVSASLYGYVDLTNVSSKACVLAGVPTVRLIRNGATMPILYTTSDNRSSPKVGLPAGGHANFRIDWDAPYCQTETGTYTMSVTLPDGGTVAAKLGDQRSPGCVHEATHANLTRSVLSVGPIESGQAMPKLSSAGTSTALGQLRATVSQAPTKIRPGGSIDFVITLSNPTASPISLAGRVGYDIEVLCQGTDGRVGLNINHAYLLNNRPVHAIPAHGSTRFAMVVLTPTTRPFPGPTLSIEWRMVAASLFTTAAAPPSASISLATAG